MHELACAMELFARMKSLVSEEKLEKVTKIRLSIGAASGIDPEFLRHSLTDHLFGGSIFEGAELAIGVESPSLVCSGCKKTFAADDISSGTVMTKCPQCGGSDFEISSGNDIKIVSIEGEK